MGKSAEKFELKREKKVYSARNDVGKLYPLLCSALISSVVGSVLRKVMPITITYLKRKFYKWKLHRRWDQSVHMGGSDHVIHSCISNHRRRQKHLCLNLNASQANGEKWEGDVGKIDWFSMD